MTNAEARFNNSLRPWKPEGSLGRTAQDVHLDSHTAPELWFYQWSRGHKYVEKEHLKKKQNRSLWHNCSNPMHLLCAKMSRYVWQNVFELKALTLSIFSPTQSLFLWCWGVKSVVRMYQLWQLPGQSGWHQMRSVVLHCPCQFLATLPVSHYSFACRTDHISQLSIISWKRMQKPWLFISFFTVVMIVLNRFLPLALTLNWLAISHLVKKVNKPAMNLPVPVKVWDLTGTGKMLIFMEGPKQEDTKSSAVTHWASTDFCRRHERLNSN